MDTSGYSTERLIRLAFDYQLISDYRMTPGRIELCLPSSVSVFDPEEARFFLRGLIRGYEEYSRQLADVRESTPTTSTTAAAA